MLLYNCPVRRVLITMFMEIGKLGGFKNGVANSHQSRRLSAPQFRGRLGRPGFWDVVRIFLAYFF